MVLSLKGDKQPGDFSESNLCPRHEFVRHWETVVYVSSLHTLSSHCVKLSGPAAKCPSFFLPRLFNLAISAAAEPWLASWVILRPTLTSPFFLCTLSPVGFLMSVCNSPCLEQRPRCLMEFEHIMIWDLVAAVVLRRTECILAEYETEIWHLVEGSWQSLLHCGPLRSRKILLHFFKANP